MASNSELKKFAQAARRQLREQVAGRLEQVLRVDSVEVREKKNAVDQLKKQIAENGKEAVIDQVAYTWFNRFCALRYMDANLYNPVRIVSPTPGNVQPEILQEAKAGYIPDEWKISINKEKVFGLLSGSIRSENGQQEAYRILLVGVCNAYYKIMPFMFEEIEDYTELLIPLDLLSENSVLYQTREALSVEACQDVEVIGWLYQYYISERKDEVFEGLDQNQKIEAKDIPAATQLFTPHWIVRYLVENSLGRLWLLNHPDSKITEKMEYYIKPVNVETDFLKVVSPEELKICDPACGSGHMLTYAFDLLYPIYEEQGFDPTIIPSLILQKNLYGIEIDGRAGALSAFALFMKARSKDKRFFTREIQPNICVLKNVNFTDQEIKEYIHAVGRDLFTEPLIETLKQFEQADNFGSLIRPILTNASYARGVLEGRNLAGNILLYGVHAKVIKVLEYCEYLSSRYHVVVANPPYMGARGMNKELKNFADSQFPSSKTDLFSMFIERNCELNPRLGLVGMITMHSWMFLTSFENLRIQILEDKTILTMAHLGPRAFDSIGGEVVSTTAFIIENVDEFNKKSEYLRLVDDSNEFEKAIRIRQAIIDRSSNQFFYSSSNDFRKIPGSPIAYWVSSKVREIFEKGIQFKDIGNPMVGMQTSNNEKYLRLWHEINYSDLILKRNNYPKWIKYLKGGPFRRWYGNLDYLLWLNFDPSFILSQPNATVLPLSRMHTKKCTWTDITSSLFSCRLAPEDTFHDISGHCFYPSEDDQFWLLGYTNSKQFNQFLSIVNSSLHNQVGDIGKMPILEVNKNQVTSLVKELVDLSKCDWDAYEISWDFKNNPLLCLDSREKSIADVNEELITKNNRQIEKMQQLESHNNRIFIEAYSLEDEITSEVSFEEITLTCNPQYRYGPGKTEEEYERLQRADTMKEFISYSVGCMFGRYSLDKPGLILANQGETLQDYLRQVPDPIFMPDEDNVIPFLGGDWFADDITERFKKFLKVTFGEEYYSENLQFIEDAIGRDIQSYLLKDFYAYHIKMYKKRPIYWLFSSPKGTFNVLIYMHRYNKDTVSIILNNYLREFRVKLESRKSYMEQVNISDSTSQTEKIAALRELEMLKKQLEEITTYETKVVFPLATKQIEIDLDDGVKANYPKFGEALVKIQGL